MIISMYGVVVMFFDWSSVYTVTRLHGGEGGRGGGGGGGGGAPLNRLSLKLLLKTWQLCCPEYLTYISIH